MVQRRCSEKGVEKRQYLHLKYTKGRHAIRTQFENKLQIGVCTDANVFPSFIMRILEFFL